MISHIGYVQSHFYAKLSHAFLLTHSKRTGIKKLKDVASALIWLLAE
jgi:hypothetical protein